MAVEAAKIIISAKDETRAAFESIKGSFATVTGLASALGAGALAVAVKQAANFADEMQEAAEKVGLTTKSLSELKYAADLNGDSFEALQVGIKRLSSTMLDFADGNKNAQDLFRRLGVEVVDASGKLRGSDSVLKDIADRFQDLPNGAQKTALAIQLFGKSGADLIPLLNQGSEGFRKFADEAERFGLVVNDDAANAAAQFNDNIDRLGSAFEGFKIQAATSIIPALTEITEKMVEAIKQGGLLKGLLIGYGESFKSLLFGSTASNQAKRSDFGIPSEIQRLQGQLLNDANGSNPLSNVDRFKIQQEIQQLAREKNNIDKALGRLDSGDSKTKSERDLSLPSGSESSRKAEIGNAAFAKQSQELATLIQNFQKAAEGPRSQAEDLQKTLDTYRALNPEVQTYLQGLIDQVAQREMLTRETEAWQRQQDLNADFDARELQALEEQSAAEVAKTEAMERQATAIRELLDPQLKLLNMQQEYTELLDAGLLSQEEYAAALDKLAESQKDLADNGKTSLDDLKRAVEGFSKDAASAFVDFAFTGKASFGDMVESILKDLARLAIQRGVTDPLVKGLDDSGFLNSIGEGFKSIFGGARAAGGPVASGKAYLVGERGPEIFMPSASGTIIPNGAGGGMSVSVNVDASGSRAQGNGDQALAVGNAIGEAVRQELLRQRRPGGLLA